MPRSRFEASAPANTKLGAAKRAAGDIDYLFGLAPTSRRHRVVAGGGVLVRICRADFYRLLEPTPQSAIADVYRRAKSTESWTLFMRQHNESKAERVAENGRPPARRRLSPDHRLWRRT
jgi:hypothetical protein